MKHKLLFFPIGLMLLIVVACNKNVENGITPNSSSSKGKLQFRTNGLSPDNSSNPIDSVGIMHNDLLSHAWASVGHADGTNLFEIQTEIQDYAFSEYGITDVGGDVPTDIDLVKDSTNFSVLIPSGTIKDKIALIVSPLQDGVDQGEGYAYAKGLIVDWELNEITNDNSIDAETKEALYGFGSVLRYSLALWTNYLEPTTDPVTQNSLVGGVADAAGFVKHYLANDANAHGITRVRNASSYASQFSAAIESAWEAILEAWNIWMA